MQQGAGREPAPRGPDRTARRTKFPTPRVPEPPPQAGVDPARLRPAADSSGLTHRDGGPAGPVPAECAVEERKEARRAARTHHGPRGHRCAVQGSQRPSAWRSAAPALVTHTHARRAHAVRASPPPRARAAAARPPSSEPFPWLLSAPPRPAPLALGA
jgi:hypothetical protein